MHTHCFGCDTILSKPFYLHKPDDDSVFWWLFLSWKNIGYFSLNRPFHKNCIYCVCALSIILKRWPHKGWMLLTSKCNFQDSYILLIKQHMKFMLFEKKILFRLFWCFTRTHKECSSDFFSEMCILLWLQLFFFSIVSALWYWFCLGFLFNHT